jgi:hypothetical protein
LPRLHDGKFKSNLLGPFVIVDVPPLGNTVRLQLPPLVTRSDLFHVDQIAPFHVQSGERTGHDSAWICNGGTPDLPTEQIIAKLVDYDHSTRLFALSLRSNSNSTIEVPVSAFNYACRDIVFDFYKHRSFDSLPSEVQHFLEVSDQ